MMTVFKTTEKSGRLHTCEESLETTDREVGILVDKDDLINYQLLIIYGLLLRIFTYQPTVDKTILISTNC